MLTLRPACWPDDLAALERLDTSFTTNRIYRVAGNELGFRLVEERLEPPLRKDYGPLPQIDDRLAELEYALIAELDGELVGFGATEYEAWNRRAIVRHLYVAPEHRRAGIGMLLLSRLEGFARTAGARCLWLETQNVNVPAIRFYRRAGFRLCGLDESFYDPAAAGPDEVALFFVRDV
jgi:ribosomal protein S18 acetylase RimI-like enzyme